MTIRKSSFAPVVAPDTRLLILGSLPGEASLQAQRYYAHPRNLFWHLTGQAIGRDLTAMDYKTRLETLLAEKIGLWDVVASATRQGSLDTAIRDVAHNSLRELAHSLPDLRAIAFNGAKSAKIGMNLLDGEPYHLLALPSSSPAYAAMPRGEKEKLWQKLDELRGLPLASGDERAH
ncbi:DNA-deoxyinosine glycosylase [Altericroceibacterium spongiae]|uniref:DNA-deoxyinosine glycosylase n=1 Tax=Altericroceibacterium spongiae TaxID=2320269 RepID=A0A420EQT4_9SPHN|nr:DNA-deoxyinosine glycosylase [Altericroceibacterium spongiae]RKF23037.1 DNA-deoxyinosine glycosylase [Altericroceibacterium spongiae]